MSTPVLPTSEVTHHDWTLWSVDARLVVTDPRTLREAHDLVTAITDRVGALASRFREESAVRRLARSGADDEVIDPLLATLIREALTAARFTDGDVDPTRGVAMQRNGYAVDISQLRARSAQAWPATPNRSAFTVATREPAWRHVHLDGDRLTMPRGILLDLGATAKALTADWCARAVVEQFGGAALVSLGGDIATAGTSPDGGWQVAVQDLPTDRRQVVTLHDGFAIATSSTRKRAWTAGGRAAHHILDPRTLTPAEPVWGCVTVVAPSCVLANTLATVAVVRGRRALPWLAAQNAPARLVGADGRIQRVGDWPA